MPTDQPDSTDYPGKPSNPERYARATMGCHPRTMIGERAPDDPVWCWCGFEIVSGIGQCDECQDAEDMSGYSC